MPSLIVQIWMLDYPRVERDSIPGLLLEVEKQKVSSHRDFREIRVSATGCSWSFCLQERRM